LGSSIKILYLFIIKCYLKAGHPLNNFLEDFPSVKKEHAIQVLEHFENLLIS